MKSSEKLDLAPSKVCSLWSAVVDRAIWMHRQLYLLLLLALLTLLPRRRGSGPASRPLLALLLLLFGTLLDLDHGQEPRVIGDVHILRVALSIHSCCLASPCLVQQFLDQLVSRNFIRIIALFTLKLRLAH